MDKHKQSLPRFRALLQIKNNLSFRQLFVNRDLRFVSMLNLWEGLVASLLRNSQQSLR